MSDHTVLIHEITVEVHTLGRAAVSVLDPVPYVERVEKSLGELQARIEKLEEALKLFADENEWDVMSRHKQDWDEHIWQGDDGHEHPWEFAQEALDDR